MGARANGVGLSSSCLSDQWSIFNNPAGLAGVKNSVLASTYIHHPSIASFNTVAAIFATPLKLGALGIGVYRFGDDLYNEQVLTTGYSNTFGIASLGIKLNYLQYQAEGFGNKAVASISFGGIAQLTPQFQIGAYINNITQPEVTDYDRLPTSFILGVAFHPDDQIFITTEVEKDIDYDPRWKAGLEYVVHKKFFLRTGFNLQPQSGFFGFGYRSDQPLQLDYAFSYTPAIGSIHQATVGYHFKKKNK